MRRVAIVGRPNVGKSALFNRLAGRKLAIVHDQAGVTRDFVSATARLGQTDCEIIDTGGIGSDPDPDFARSTHRAAERAVREADLILFIVDGLDGATPLDEELARTLRSSGKPVLLVVNKIDNPRREAEVVDFARLGFAEVAAVSAAHGRGAEELARQAEAMLPERSPDEPRTPSEAAGPRIAVVGKPNAGKSSLVNAILGDDRVIVSEIAGTTRDSVDVPFRWKGEPFTFIDTAGLRHRSRHNTSVEVFSAMRAEKSIRSADLCLLVADAAAGITGQDKRVAGMVEEAGKAVIVVLSKWDLVEQRGGGRQTRNQQLEEALQELFFVRYAPAVTLSALRKKGLDVLLREIIRVRDAARQPIGTGPLNRTIRTAIERQSPPLRGNRRFKILYATQLLPSEPRPFAPAEILLFVNDPKLVTDSYTQYLKRAIRADFPLPGVPIHFHFRRRQES